MEPRRTAIRGYLAIPGELPYHSRLAPPDHKARQDLQGTKGWPVLRGQMATPGSGDPLVPRICPARADRLGSRGPTEAKYPQAPPAQPVTRVNQVKGGPLGSPVCLAPKAREAAPGCPPA